MAQYGKFTLRDAQKIAQAVRDVRGQTRAMLKVPYRPAIRQGGGSSTATSGFPTGTGACDCGHCVEGVTMPASSTICCESHPILEFYDPFVPYLDADSEVAPRRLAWSTGNVWLSDAFTGPDCIVEAEDESACTTAGGTWVDPVCTISPGNVYKWKLTVAADVGDTILELALVTDNDCPVACLKYVTTKPWQCKCDNPLDINETWENIARGEVACRVCIKPVPIDPASSCGDITKPVLVEFEQTDVGGWSITDFAATYLLEYDSGEWTDTNSRIRLACELPFCLSSGWGGGDNGLVVYVKLCGECLSDAGDCYFDAVECDPGDDEILTVFGNPGAFTFGEDETVQPNCHDFYSPDEHPGRNYIGTFITNIGDSPDSSGSCTTCTTAAAPTDDAGACCLVGVCADMSETDCTAFGGTWFASDAACDAGCTGACVHCAPTGVDGAGEYFCQDFTSAEFCTPENLGLTAVTWYGGLECTELEGFTAGEACDWEAPLGSCCDTSDGSCVDAVTDADCADTWTEGGSCADCEIACTGTCCYSPSGPGGPWECDDTVVSEEACGLLAADYSWCPGVCCEDLTCPTCP